MPDLGIPVTETGNFTNDANAESAFTKAINSGQTVALGTGSGWNPSSSTSSTTTQPNVVPPAVKQAAAQAPPSAPSPIYTGPSVNSIPHVANQLGTNAVWNQQTGQFNVNGVPIQPTSVINGIHHAPVYSIAQAAGFPPTNIQQTDTGVNVMPRTDTTGVSGSNLQTQLNPYWQGVQRQGGAYATPVNGETPQQLAQSEAKKYNINVNQVQVLPSGHTFVPWQFVAPVAQAQSAFEAAQVGANAIPQQPVQGTGVSYQDQLNQAISNYLNSVAQNAPIAPQLTQLPTFNSSMLPQFNFNAQQDAQDQFNALNPQFQQQMLQADLKNNDDMNKRGLFNSGIAQQAENQLNTGILGQETQAVNKQVLADRTETFKEWQAQAQMQLDSYKANLDAAYQQGQLNNAQYADSLKVWQEGNTAMQNAMDQQAKLVDQMQSNMLPWDMGPTPQQQITDAQSQQKIIQDALQAAGYSMLPDGSVVPTEQAQQNAFNDAFNQFKFNNLSADQAATLGLDQQKLQVQIAQDTVTNQQKWASIMGVGPDGTPTLDAQKLQETINKDTQTALSDANKTSNSAISEQITGLHDQLVQAGNIIKSINTQLATTQDPATKQQLQSQLQDAMSNYNAINSAITVAVQGLGK